MKYRKDIDGLRAIAVLIVVFYHAGLGFPGGYVGVDVFFVISGYLITGLILKDLERGAFSLANFWERRIRRIFPALAVMVAGTMVAGWFLLLPDDLAKLGASVIAQALLVSNFYFWRTTNYFGGANEEKPLLHTWSLAVEEQFYLIFPIALMAIWAYFNYRLRKIGTTNDTKGHEHGGGDFNTEDTESTIERRGRREMEQSEVGPKGEGAGATESKGGAGLRLAGQAGAAFSNPSTSELARDSENTSLNRSAIGPASSLATSHSTLDTGLSSLDSKAPAASPIGDTRRWALFWIFAAVALLSLVLSTWGVKAQPFATFFLLPTRAWELLIGSMLAVLPATVVIRSAALRELLSLVGLAGIFVPVFFYGEQTPFPGLAALPPCFGTAILIWANTPASAANSQGWIARWLAWRPMVFIGLISYSLYLWHWPVISFAKYLGVFPQSPVAQSILLASIFALSIFSWKFVEQPFRLRAVQGNFKKVFSFGLAANGLVLGIGFWFLVWAGLPERFSEQARSVFEKLEADQKAERELGLHLPETTDPNLIKMDMLPNWGADAQGNHTVLVWGDSHARAPIYAMHEMMRAGRGRGLAVIHHSTPPLIGFNHKMGLGLPREVGEEISGKVLQLVRENRISKVFLSGYWSIYQAEIGEDRLRLCLQDTVAQLQVAGAEVVVFGDWPDQDLDPTRLAILENLRIPKNWMPSARTKQEHYQRNSAFYQFRIQSPDIPTVDLAEFFLEPCGTKFRTQLEGWPAYSDHQHIGLRATESLLKNPLSAFQ